MGRGGPGGGGGIRLARTKDVGAPGVEDLEGTLDPCGLDGVASIGVTAEEVGIVGDGGDSASGEAAAESASTAGSDSAGRAASGSATGDSSTGVTTVLDTPC